MHDIESEGSTAAVRLAAVAALKKVQSEGIAWGSCPGPAPYQVRLQSGSEPPSAPPRLNPEGSADVFAAVEAAVRKSRDEFLGRLQDYSAALDCTALKEPAAMPDAKLDEAQFIAHRIAGVGKTFGYAALGDAARATENAILAWKQEQSDELRRAAVAKVCNLADRIDAICDDP